MASAVRLLRNQWQRSCERLVQRLDGLSDDEYRWEPVDGCWNVRPSPDAPGGWIVDYPEVHPDPPPFTTVAWRMLHISDGNTIYWEHAFGPAKKNFWDLAPPGSALDAIDYLIESQRPITATLTLLDDDQLDEERPTQFGVPWPARRVLAVIVDEQLHHGAEIGVLRDLYRAGFHLASPAERPSLIAGSESGRPNAANVAGRGTSSQIGARPPSEGVI